MAFNSNNLETILLEKLTASNYVDYILMSSILDNIIVETLKKLVSTLCNIEVVEEGLSFTDSSGDIIACPNFSANISDDGLWLSSKIPDIGFDVEQGGNLRKAEEAESAYYFIIIVLVLKDELFRK